MKVLLAGAAAVALLMTGAAGAYAQDTTTVVKKESADGDKSKTTITKDNGSKTVIKRHGANMKKVHTNAEGDKTVVEKKVDQ